MTPADFKPGDRVRWVGTAFLPFRDGRYQADKVGKVTHVNEDGVRVIFEPPYVNVGVFDEAWFRLYPGGLIVEPPANLDSPTK